MYDALESIAQVIKQDSNWFKGWRAVCVTIKRDGGEMPSDALGRIASLKTLLKPTKLEQQIEALVLSNTHGSFDLVDLYEVDTEEPISGYHRAENIVTKLGQAVGADMVLFRKLVPKFFQKSSHLFALGRGIAESAQDPHIIWKTMRTQAVHNGGVRPIMPLLIGILSALDTREKALGSVILDEAVSDDFLAPVYPELQLAVAIDDAALERLRHAISYGFAPSHAYAGLAYVNVTHALSVKKLCDLLLDISELPEGLGVALKIFGVQCHTKILEPPWADIAVGACVRELLGRVTFCKDDEDSNYYLLKLIERFLQDSDGATVVRDICRNLDAAVASGATYAFRHGSLLAALFKAQPIVVLDTLFSDEKRKWPARISLVRNSRSDEDDKPAIEGHDSDILAWCNIAPNSRFPIAASIVALSESNGDGSVLRWTNIATKLIAAAPNRAGVLRRFIARFYPTIYGGSLASILEARAALLDKLDISSDPELSELVLHAKQDLKGSIESIRENEHRISSQRNETFE